MQSRMPSIRLRLTERYGDSSLIRAIPEQYWHSFVLLFQEGINCFFPTPGRAKMYWRVTKDAEDLELLYLESYASEATSYYERLVEHSLDFFVTKQDWDKRFNEILRDSA